MRSSNKKGFTLIELMSIVVIIGVLASVALVNYDKARRTSEWAEATVALEIMYKAVNSYFLEYDKWPVATTWAWASASCTADINPFLAGLSYGTELDTSACNKFSYYLYAQSGDPTGVCPGANCAVTACRRNAACWGISKRLDTGALTYNSNTNCYP